ncbi:MAG: RNA polymerase-binding protein RbpA [Acidothermus sp.]|nr:RNA polymerase-binding protein RbpA [Acidothermus sp.]MCL6538027.1 RNA polymerase-binding protein RbpA [Acidothermus sp.]
MAERALRGSRLGAVSYENDAGTEPAQRQIVKYSCPNGHRLEVPFAADAQVPAVWECRYCGANARKDDAGPPQQPKTKPARSHWDMLRERRSIPELEALLQERLEALRQGRV